MHQSKAQKLLIAMLTIAGIGFLDALYLTYHHYTGEPPSCALLSGCETVTTSKYATIGPIPVALLGALYYVGIATLIEHALRSKTILAKKRTALAASIGFAASLVFLYLQLIIIGALCLYCLISAVTSTLLFSMGVILWRHEKHGTPAQERTYHRTARFENSAASDK